ncbi:MAG: diguanylate cyclase [Proteobacteria bacterium]|nr:diguanylate cyclase [Pseudomonadota bacterium]MBU1610260.1 diguanylate cyclase [Pseudomonadota bacterium]
MFKFTFNSFVPFAGTLCGAAILILLSTIQKAFIGITIEPSGFIIPGLVGSFAGYFLASWNLRIHLHSKELEGHVRERTIELQDLNHTLKENITRYTEMFENMDSGVAVLAPLDDGQGFQFVEFNSAGERIENISREEILGREVRQIFPALEDFGLFNVFQRVFQTGIAERFPATEYKDQRINGWRENYVYKLPSGEIVTIYNDVTERVRLENNLDRLASTDCLTGIPNRRRFLENLDREFKRAMRYGHTLSFLMLDLDHFKLVNDRYGHDIGDLVLMGATKACENILREVDEIGRIGGEEFAVLLPDTRLPDALQVAERLRHEIASVAVPTIHGDVSITVSIGVAESTMDATDARDLMRRADKALYRAKKEGRNRVES